MKELKDITKVLDAVYSRPIFPSSFFFKKLDYGPERAPNLGNSLK